MSLLDKLKEQKINKKPLYCTANSNCWCNQLTHKFELTPGYDVCMTPTQMLKYENELPEIDINYLKSIMGRECIW